LNDDALPSNAICVTFDDGYEDNLSNAVPVLRKHNVKATFFIATGYTDEGVMWNDRILDAFKNTNVDSFEMEDAGVCRRYLDTVQSRVSTAKEIIKSLKYRGFTVREEMTDRVCRQLAWEPCSTLMMSRNQLVQLRNAGMELGGHTMSHPILANEEDSDVYKEVADGKEYLEDLLQEPVRSFAYPNGRRNSDYTTSTIDAVKRAGFECAVTTNFGVSDSASEKYELKRLSFRTTSQLSYCMKLGKNCYLSR
jgi:peptidoglycan/xylan/chitin deacetylase (PgdA/CDA1 family)